MEKMFFDYGIDIAPASLARFMREKTDVFGYHRYLDLAELVEVYVTGDWREKRMVWDQLKRAIRTAYDGRVRFSPTGNSACPFRPTSMKYKVADLV